MAFWESDQFATSLVGAIVGFALAQVADIFVASKNWLWRPILEIDTLAESDGAITAQTVDTPDGDMSEEFYGFHVKNRGWSIAPDIRFQVLKIEIREKGDDANDFTPVCEAAMNLGTFKNAQTTMGDTSVTIVPDAAVQIGLGYWREDVGIIRPITDHLPDYYLESCESAIEYRFTVAAFGESVKYTSKTFTLTPR